MRSLLPIILSLFLAPKASASVSVNVNGSAYTIPQTNEKGWGVNVTNWIQAISANTLQPNGGTFTLTADANLGSSYGLIGPYFKSSSSNIAGVGVLRLNNNSDAVAWRNAANNADLSLIVNGSNQLQFNGSVLSTPAAGTFSDAGFNIYNNSDNTKKILFDASAITSGNSRTIKMADAAVDLANLNANTITSGTLSASRLPNPSASTLGGIESLASSTSKWINQISTSGVPSATQPACGDLSDSTSSCNTANASINTASTLVKRDGSGNFSAGTITANILTAPAALTEIDFDGGNRSVNPGGSNAAGGTVTVNGGLGTGTGAGSFVVWMPLLKASGSTVQDTLHRVLTVSTNDTATGIVNVQDTMTVGSASGVNGAIQLNGSTSGSVTIATTSNPSTYNFNLPTTAGSAGQYLTSQAGGSTPMTWTTFNPMTTTGDIIYSSNNSGTTARLGIGSTGQYLAVSSGLPAWKSLTKQTVTTETSTGATAGYLFTISSGNATAGATYVNNTNTYTVIQTVSAGTTVYTSGASAPTSSGTLIKSGGTGDGTLTFSSNVAMAAYTPPATAKALWVRVNGGGGGGGGTGSSAAAMGAGGGGGGGGYSEKLINSFDSTIYYIVGSGGSGASAGNNSGFAGSTSVFVDSQNLLFDNGGNGGAGAPGTSTGVGIVAGAAAGGSASGGDLNIPGGTGGPAYSYSGTSGTSGMGGRSVLGSEAGILVNQNATGVNGVGYGAGGGGGSEVNNGGTKGGGNGSFGVVIIHEIYNGN